MGTDEKGTMAFHGGDWYEAYDSAGVPWLEGSYPVWCDTEDEVGYLLGTARQAMGAQDGEQPRVLPATRWSVVSRVLGGGSDDMGNEPSSDETSVTCLDLDEASDLYQMRLLELGGILREMAHDEGMVARRVGVATLAELSWDEGEGGFVAVDGWQAMVDKVTAVMGRDPTVYRGRLTDLDRSGDAITRAQLNANGRERVAAWRQRVTSVGPDGTLVVPDAADFESGLLRNLETTSGLDFRGSSHYRLDVPPLILSLGRDYVVNTGVLPEVVWYVPRETVLSEALEHGTGSHQEASKSQGPGRPHGR